MQQDTKDFVTSKAAVGALFTMILENLSEFSVASFRAKIGKYANGGGERGLHESDHAIRMRAACRRRTDAITGVNWWSFARITRVRRPISGVRGDQNRVNRTI